MPRPVSKTVVARRSVPGLRAPQPAASAVEPRTVFLHFHIFKNAGTTLDAALEKNLGAAWRQVEGDDPDDPLDWSKAFRLLHDNPGLKVLSSHTARFPAPVHLDFRFIPLLLIRHPIDRLVSIYNFEKRRPNVTSNKAAHVAQTGSLADFMRFALAKRTNVPSAVCDAQTSWLARGGKYPSRPTRAHLEKAKAAVRSAMVPGVVEQLDQYLTVLELESAVLLPNLDLAQADQNQDPERAPSLLARLRKIRAQMPPQLWRKVCERNRLDLELWRFAHRLARARFDQTPGASGRLADFRHRKTGVNVAALPITHSIQSTNELPWTGERLVESASGELVAEHLHRYALAAEFAGQCDVLDVACGEGYGAALLAKVARKVIGVDCATSVIAHASAKYKAKNLRFVTGRAEMLPAPDNSIDLVVSFETLEHLEDHDAMLREIKRVLRPGGRLLISTPDRESYRTVSAKSNAFHVRELSLRQFQRLLATYFRHAAVGRQKSVSGSWIMPLADSTAARSEYSGTFRNLKKETAGEGAPYLIALASDAAVPGLQASLFNYTRELGLRLESLRQQRESERKSHLKLRGEFDKRTAWAQALNSDLQRIRAILAEQTKLVEERTAWAKALDADLQKTRTAFTRQVKLVEERTAWAKTLDVELQTARTKLGEQAQLVEESSAWGKSLSGELQSAQKQLAKLTKEHAERTVWAKTLDVDLKKARTDFAAQSKLIEERTAWAKSLNTELQKARANLAKQTQLTEERSVWGKSLEDELQLARKHLAKLTKEHDERTAWAKTLDADLQKARTALADQSKLVEERTDWAKAVGEELQAAQKNLAQVSKEHAEQTAWAKALDGDLTKAHTAFGEQIKLVEERTTWAKALEVELTTARAVLAEQFKQVEERTAWARSLDADLQKTCGALSEQTKLVEERTAWAKSLDADFQKARTDLAAQIKLVLEGSARSESLAAELLHVRNELAEQTHLSESRLSWGKSLESDLESTRSALAGQTKLAEEISAWGKALEAELKKAHILASDREKSKQQTLKALSAMHRDLLGKSAEASANASNLIDGRLRIEVAESEVRRLTGVLDQAVAHVDHLLAESQSLQMERLVSAETLRQKQQELASTAASLQSTRKELTRYESRLLCRLAAGRSGKRKAPSLL